MKMILLIGEGVRVPDEIGARHGTGGMLSRRVETLSEAVRVLLSVKPSLIVIDHATLRLGARGTLDLFGQVAPGVPVAVVLGPEDPARIHHELAMAGCRILIPPVTVEQVLEEAQRHVAERSGVTCASRADV